jgi:hypothetical protein
MQTIALRLRIAAIALGAGMLMGGALASVPAAQASPSAVAQVKTLYRAVLSAEYFGPASEVCSHLTAAGVAAFTAGGAGTCIKAFDQQQHFLRHKTRGVDDSGYTPAQWRAVVKSVLAHLDVTVHGKSASAIGGQSGLPGETKLVKVKGHWLFNSYPPSIEP